MYHGYGYRAWAARLVSQKTISPQVFSRFNSNLYTQFSPGRAVYSVLQVAPPVIFLILWSFSSDALRLMICQCH